MNSNEKTPICRAGQTNHNRIRHIIWSTDVPDARQLKIQGHHTINYTKAKRIIQNAHSTGAKRSSLKNPAEKILSVFKNHDQVALCGALCQSVEDLQIIYGYFLEPAFRFGCIITIYADINISQLSISKFHDNQWRYNWTLERLLHLVAAGQKPVPVKVCKPANSWKLLLQKVSRLVCRSQPIPALPTNARQLDHEQMSAVYSGEGVVQIIAPAGSGKTTVLIERVKELERRGTPAANILCMSFNRDSTIEIGERLIKSGVVGVQVRSFHGMGLAILKAEGKLRNGIGSISDEDLECIIAQTTKPDSTPAQSLTITEARNLISNYKLALMIPPETALRQARATSGADLTSAQVYDLYQKELLHRGLLDFDDLVANVVTLLQTNVSARARWQARFHRVLVDEYQDIEPAQALLVGILAAPQDSLFCVGDEDQCIYAWRRATVQRIIELDQVYPGLERHALIRNYRCGRRITHASRRLIENNKMRFKKPLKAGAKIKGDIACASCRSRSEAADLVAYLISDANPENTAVLARTSLLLAEVKAACDNLPHDCPGIELATIHGSKGREWDRVILYACDEGQTPHSRASSEADIEDERRLFYVALTRAKSRLEIVYTQDRPSRFLGEAGVV